ncbi:MAG TPA: hypothetical protein VG052_16680 [Puia sp.]|jgi:hypothetical protein|nr:hypothetical protein [Puia sp.]
MNHSKDKKLIIKKHRLVLLALCFFLAAPPAVKAQCSICTRTAQQLGERPARALNRGIIYLAFTPLAIFGFIGYRWWKSEQGHE